MPLHAEDELEYAEVIEELKNGTIRQGLMAMALVETNGDGNRAQLLYLQYRVALPKEEKRQIVEAQRKWAAEAAKQAIEKRKRDAIEKQRQEVLEKQKQAAEAEKQKLEAIEQQKLEAEKQAEAIWQGIAREQDAIEKRRVREAAAAKRKRALEEQALVQFLADFPEARKLNDEDRKCYAVAHRAGKDIGKEMREYLKEQHATPKREVLGCAVAAVLALFVLWVWYRHR